MSDIEVYMSAPEAARPHVRRAQWIASEKFREARALGMPHDTFDEIAAERDREIERAVEHAIGHVRRKR